MPSVSARSALASPSLPPLYARREARRAPSAAGARFSCPLSMPVPRDSPRAIVCAREFQVATRCYSRQSVGSSVEVLHGERPRQLPGGRTPTRAWSLFGVCSVRSRQSAGVVRSLGESRSRCTPVQCFSRGALTALLLPLALRYDGIFALCGHAGWRRGRRRLQRRG